MPAITSLLLLMASTVVAVDEASVNGTQHTMHESELDLETVASVAETGSTHDMEEVLVQAADTVPEMFTVTLDGIELMPNEDEEVSA